MNGMYDKVLAWGRVKNCMRELTAYGNARKAEIGAENVFDFSLGSPSAPVPAAVTQALLEALEEPAAHVPAPEEGLPEFRAAVSRDLNDRYGTGLRPEDVFAVTGAAGGLAAALHALLAPGGEAVVFVPFFTEYRVFIEGAGGVCVPVPPDPSMQPDLEAFEAALTERTRLVLVNSPNNPTGVILSKTLLKRIGEILRRAKEHFGHTIWLVSDEPYRELVYDGVFPCVLNAWDDSLLCYSFSKSLSLPGDRIGYLAVNPRSAERDRVWDAIRTAARALGYAGAPALMQRALTRCVGMQADLALYKRNRDLLYDGLTALGFDCVRPDGAFYLFVKAPVPDARAFSEAAKKYELLLVPSDDFGIGGYLRLAYCVPTDTIRRAMPVFGKLAEEYGLCAPET